MEKEFSMKKIAIVLNSSWQAYNFRLNLAQYLTRVGYKVIIFAPKDGHYCHYIEKKFDFVDIKLQPNGMNPFQDIKLFFSLFFHYRKIKPDVVLNFTIKYSSPVISNSLIKFLLSVITI